MPRYRRRMPPEEREALDKMLARARRSARTEIRDGRKFKVLVLPDRYGATGRDDDEPAVDTEPAGD